ncbi:MAG TPA: hypothetical protein VGR96_15380 [Acidobacteriaceae bacterium]|nr:hypothetical protein [Acidobacteriaceae bacterium]
MQFDRRKFMSPRWIHAASSAAAWCVAILLVLSGAPQLLGQSVSDSQLSAGPRQAPAKSPALADPAGPEISLQTSEALFDVAAGLNSCGYDDGLSASDPVRMHIRDEINQALVASAEARDAHDRLCTFIAQHRLSDAGINLAQYISLALYVTPPPELTPSVENADMPPDSAAVMDILPILRSFSELVNLHLIWIHSRPQYDQDLAQLHDSLTKMIVDTNVYLRTPANTVGGQRFLVVVEPLLDPRQINARVYGSDYVVVVSPVNGTIRMDEVRHSYLHYEIEPLLYARAKAMDRLLPFLKVVSDAPIDDTFRTDVVALVVESMIRAIEARTMDTGVTIYKIPSDIRRADLEAATRQHNATVEQAEMVRRKAVLQSTLEGFVLTGYFYSAFAAFEHQPQGFSESIGEMVYGMDVEAELNRVKHIDFLAQAPAEVVQKAPRQPKALELAEASLMKGDAEQAGKLAQQALSDKTTDPGRANFILARVAIMRRDIPAAQHDFTETIRLSKDPRLLAWSHIYLGRIYDVQDQRDQAVTEYQAALTLRDGQQDTKLAAEKGLKQAYAVPQQTHTEPADDDSSSDSSGKSDPPAAAQQQEQPR